MGIHLGRKGAKPAPSKTGFAAISGHRSLIDRDAIKKGNQERLLKAVGDGVNALSTTITNHRAKQKAGRILSEE